MMERKVLLQYSKNREKSQVKKKREKEMKELRNNLEVGDNVVTECGITGRVISVKDPETVTLETGSDKTRLKFKRWAVIAKETQE